MKAIITKVFEMDDDEIKDFMKDRGMMTTIQKKKSKMNFFSCPPMIVSVMQQKKICQQK